jgi:Predicted oxidoreductases (related to aryl-alcohol dehydrogenases)
VKYWTFGRTGGQLSDVGYGMWGMGDWSGSEDNESLASLQRAIDSSLQFFATLRGSTA